MEDFIFHEGQPPQDYQLQVGQALFNQQAHLHLQSAYGWHSFFMLHKKLKQVLAGIHFHIENEIARSPLKNPFGSIDISEGVTSITLFKFLEFIDSRLSEKGVRKIIIKNPSTIYQGDHAALLQTFLLNLGYQVNDAEVSTVININESENFQDVWERRKLRQANEAGLEFKTLSMERLSEIYAFILACRNERNYSLSMTLPDLKKTIDQFPEHYMLFAVTHQQKLAAASIAIKVKDDILYNFYSAHPNEYNHLSPVVMLIEGICKYCQQNNFKFLDLGTSAIEGKPNFNLLDFKLRLGAKPYAKLTFEKNL